MRLKSRVALVSAAFSLATFAAVAKRAPARPVAPVESNGIRYSADRNGRNQYVEATDVATGKRLWRVRVFHTHVKPWIEEDVQWVFISDLRVVGNSLFVRDEKARCYAVGIRDHRVRKAACGGVFAKHESSEQ